MAFDTFRVDGALYGERPFFDPEVLREVLDVFVNDADFAPDWWSTSERRKPPFDREAALAEARVNLPRPASVVLWGRRKAPKYDVRVPLTQRPGLIWHVDPKLSERHYPALFALADRLVAAYRPNIGLLHRSPAFPEAPDAPTALYIRRGMLFPVDAWRTGPAGLATRTWLGPHYVERIGRAVIDATPDVEVTWQDWGGVRLDLGAEPWSRSPEDVAARQAAAMAHLAASGVFADLSFDRHRRPVFAKGPKHALGCIVPIDEATHEKLYGKRG
mgnify:CR=1 FL=1